LWTFDPSEFMTNNSPQIGPFCNRSRSKTIRPFFPGAVPSAVAVLIVAVSTASPIAAISAWPKPRDVRTTIRRRPGRRSEEQ
jgi:hypothetical protein